MSTAGDADSTVTSARRLDSAREAASSFRRAYCRYPVTIYTPEHDLIKTLMAACRKCITERTQCSTGMTQRVALRSTLNRRERAREAA